MSKILIYKQYIASKSPRSKQAVKNIALSLVGKAISVLSSLLIVPLTINYVNPTRYGIWLTLSSVIAWVGFFDLGMGNGFRNKFAEAKAKGDMILARKYLSTTYVSISFVIAIVFILGIICNCFVDWSSVLNVDSSYKEELSQVFLIIFCFFCLNMIASIIGTLMVADQKPGIQGIIGGLGNLCSLIVIFVLTKISHGSLTNLALYFAGIPCMVWLIASLYFFIFTPYRVIKPSIKYYDSSLLKDIMGLGFQFFVIYLCMILIFQIVNVVISREIGPGAVTEYNIAYKYFSVSHMIIMIIVNPFWSAFTDAFQKKDYDWMKNVKKKLEYIWLLSVIAVILMLLISSPVYHLWIGDDVTISFSVSLMLAIFVVSDNLAAAYISMINGIGYIKVQLLIYITIAIVSWPLMVWGGRNFGIVGVLLVPTLCTTMQTIFAYIQLEKILMRKESGIWKK